MGRMVNNLSSGAAFDYTNFSNWKPQSLCVVCKQDKYSHDYEAYMHPFFKDNLELLEYECSKHNI